MIEAISAFVLVTSYSIAGAYLIRAGREFKDVVITICGILLILVGLAMSLSVFTIL